MAVIELTLSGNDLCPGEEVVVKASVQQDEDPSEIEWAVNGTPRTEMGETFKFRTAA